MLPIELTSCCLLHWSFLASSLIFWYINNHDFSYVYVVGDGDYCDFTLSVLMSQFSFSFDSSLVESRVLDQVYMVMIILQVLVLLQDFDLLPTGSTLWCLIHRCLYHLCLSTPYHIRWYWWWLLYYVVFIAIMIPVISILYLLRISFVVTSLFYNDTITMIIIFQHLDWCFIWYWSHRLLIILTLETIYFHQV